MQQAKAYANEKGSTLIMAIVVLAAISVMGVTMITLSTNEMDMATNEKVKQIALFNCDTCTVSINQLIQLIVDQSNQGGIGVGAGLGSLAPGIDYAAADTGYSDEEEFARKILFGLNTDTCEDVWLSPTAIGNAVNAASGGNFLISSDPDVAVPELDSAADIIMSAAEGVSPGVGNASEEFAAGNEGLGGGGPSGLRLFFLIACRGRAPYGALHVNYSVYRTPVGQ